MKPEWLDRVERNIEPVTSDLTYINSKDLECLLKALNKAYEALGFSNIVLQTAKEELERCNYTEFARIIGKQITKNEEDLSYDPTQEETNV